MGRGCRGLPVVVELALVVVVVVEVVVLTEPCKKRKDYLQNLQDIDTPLSDSRLDKKYSGHKKKSRGSRSGRW